MTIKCEFCNGLGKDEDANDCAWCWGTGSKAAQNRMAPPAEAATPDRVTTAQPAGQAQRHTIAHLRYAGGEEHNVKYVSEVDYDRVVAEREQLQLDLTARDEELDRLRAEQHQGEPVAWQIRSKTNRPESQWTPWKECCEMTRAMHSHEVGRFNQFGIMREIRPVYTHADPGEVERLRAEIKRLQDAAEMAARVGAPNFHAKNREIRILSAQRDSACARADKLEAQLAEREALLRDSRGCVQDSANNADCAANQLLYTSLLSEIDVALSASAEPSAPIAWHVGGNGYDRICFEEPRELPGHPCVQAINDQRQLISLLKRYNLRDEEPSAPVERDELRLHLERMIGQAEYMLELAENSSDPDEEDDGSFDECREYINAARDALERKP